jgi:hypothetical protein
MLARFDYDPDDTILNAPEVEHQIERYQMQRKHEYDAAWCERCRRRCEGLALTCSGCGRNGQ